MTPELNLVKRLVEAQKSSVRCRAESLGDGVTVKHVRQGCLEMKVKIFQSEKITSISPDGETLDLGSRGGRFNSCILDLKN